MLEVIKYQLLGKRNRYVLVMSILLGVNLAAFALEFCKAAFPGTSDSLLGFWMFVAIVSTGIVNVVMFVKCSSGHVDELLYRDTSYLTLTLPRRGWEILGGRFLAGAVEYLAYFIPAAVFALFHSAALSSIFVTGGSGGFGQFLSYVLRQTLGQNPAAFIKICVMAASVYITAGIFITFAAVASRSLVKTKGLATAVSIAVFIALANWTVDLGTKLSDKLNLHTTLGFTFDQTFSAMNGVGLEGTIPVSHEVVVPLAPFILFILLAGICFAAASWLFEHKVEL
jgi:hypothetical protein